MTTSTTINTRMLNPGSKVRLYSNTRTIEGIIVKVNPKNYRVKATDGRMYNAPRRMRLEFLGMDKAGLHEAMVQPYAAPEAPTFKAGDPVKITGKGAGRFEGIEGLIAKVNRTRYAVIIEGTGQVNVPFSMVAPID